MSTFQSKKLLAALGSLLTVVLVNVIGIDKEVAASITSAVVIIAGIYLTVQSGVDITKEVKKPKAPKNPQ